ncbi:MAG: 2OG-Fe(II) oxygenase family protein [Pseudomonadota bacterium]
MSESPPVISRLELEQPATLAALDLACRNWGVFYLTEHGLPDAEQLFAEARRFFAGTAEDKNTVRRTATNAWGFYDAELTKNTRDWKETFDFGPAVGTFRAQWPAYQPALRHVAEQHYAACEVLSYELLSAISANLGVGGSFLFHAFEPDHSSFVRLNHYPECPEPSAPSGPEVPAQGYLGVNHHTDAGALTLLLTDGVPGLEVYVQDVWREIPPLDGALIINLGDVLQVWSNDRYRAPLHRVRSQTRQPRMSVPFFFNPKDSFDYAPLGTPDAARYHPINFGEFRRLRALGDYVDRGEEVQIEHFRDHSGGVE